MMIIVANKSGQLANRLFLFAHTIAFASEYSLTVANPSFDEYSDLFEHISGDLFCRFPERKSTITPTARRRRQIYDLVEIWSHRFYWHPSYIPKGIEIIEIDLKQGCCLNEPEFQEVVFNNWLVAIRGWRYRDLAAFEKHAGTIRRFFEPISTTRKNVATLIQSCRDTSEILVGVHIRRGDYKEFKDGRYYFEAVQYTTLMHQMDDLFPYQKVLFLICSNELLSREAFEGFNFRFGNNHIAEDLYSFAECDYIIGPPSTYTMWASFYGQVPLYKIIDPNDKLALSSFSIADGNCDLQEDIETSTTWGNNQHVSTLPQTTNTVKT